MSGRGLIIVGIVSGAVLLAILVYVTFVWLPAYLVPATQVPSAADRIKLQDDLRAIGVQAIGGAVLLIGLYFTWRTLALNREGQITDRFTKAVDQLGSDKSDIRIGGTYALARIARTSRIDHWPIMEILAAAVRQQAPVNDSVPPDVQIILQVIRNRSKGFDPPGSFVNLDGACLPRIPLVRAELRRVSLMRARLDGADLNACDLRRANLGGASLVNTRLTRARLEGTQLGGAILRGANLGGAQLDRSTKLSGAKLTGANLGGAMLEGVDLRNVALHGTKFGGARMKGADARGVDLSTTKWLSPNQCAGLITDSNTKLPVLPSDRPTTSAGSGPI